MRHQLLLLLSILFSPVLCQKNETDVEIKDIATNKTEIEGIAVVDKEEIKKNEEVKNELDRAVVNLNGTQGKEGGGTIPALKLAGVSCSSLECNNRGTCIGSKTAFICACQLGFAGRTCDETVCDSVRDCNGRGLCIGTSTTVTCICQLGFGGPRCETPF